MQKVSHCQFCLKHITIVSNSNLAADKNWQCSICGFQCCGECMVLHYKVAHKAEYEFWQTFPELLEERKVIFFPYRKRNK